MISDVSIMNFLIYDVRRIAFHLCGILPKSHYVHSNHERTSDESKLRDILQNY